MPALLESPFMQFAFGDQAEGWSLFGPQQGEYSLPTAGMSASYLCAGRMCYAQMRFGASEVSVMEPGDSPHGFLRQAQAYHASNPNGVRFTLTFALPESHPLFLWKMEIANHGFQPIHPNRLELLRAHLPTVSNQQSANKIQKSGPAFFSNGWASLSHTGAYSAVERRRHPVVSSLVNPYLVNPATPHNGRIGHFGSDFFGVLGDRRSRMGLLAGFLSQQQHFGSLEVVFQSEAAELSLWANGDLARLDPGQAISTDWACLQFVHIDSPDPLAPYLEAVARQHSLEGSEMSRRSIPTGWCSWYHYFNKVAASDVRENLHAIRQAGADLPLQIIQLDDGFESRVGDWFSFRPAFPGGLAPLAKEIQAEGLTPGLWLAPFIAAANSRLARQHPDWLIQNQRGRPMYGGIASPLWGASTRGLDTSHPEALAYTRELVDTAVHRWGFPYLKLDFLYAAALPGRRRDPTLTRAQALRLGLEELRLAAGPQAVLLGSMCPLGPAIGLLDVMRVGPDVDVRWKPSLPVLGGVAIRDPDLPAARNAVHNTLVRAFLHRRWWINDPDCLLLRPDTQLSLAEVQTLASVIALNGGALFFSDRLVELPEERLKILRCLLPLIGQRPRLLDWFDEPTPRRLRLDMENASGIWHLLAQFNWRDAPQDLVFDLKEYELPDGQAYRGREFWSGQLCRLEAGGLVFPQIPVHGVVLLALRAESTEPQYLGSDLHISQGMEVCAWVATEDGVQFELERPGRAQGAVYLGLPRPPAACELNGEKVPAEAVAEGVYRIPVEFEASATILVHLG
jgi:alpha-galactosidase